MAFSNNHDEALEWFSIKVPDGPLTSRLQDIQVGDPVLVSKKPVGTLVIDSLLPGRRLYLLSTGTGLAPFMSIIRDPETYARFEKVILVHGCRFVAELAYADRITQDLPNDEFLGEMISEQLIYYPTVTREPFEHRGRVTDLITGGRLFEDISLPPLNPADDRVMLCGNPDLLADMKPILEERGFTEGASNHPAEYVIEKAFVER